MSVTETSVIETLARWAAGWATEGAPLPPLAEERAAEAILDTLSCILAGAGDAATRKTRAAFAAEGGAAVPCIGGRVATAGHAALVNATAAHALDYDDTFRPLMGHASAVLVPAVLAAGQAAGIAGRQLIAAYVVGLEAQAALGAAMNPGHYAAGWHATSTVGAVGAAAGAARALGLDAAGIARAMTLAVSMAAGVKGQFGTPAKPLHAGLAARNAVEAALLARAGLSGRLDIVEQGFGFARLYAGAGEPFATVLARLGAPLAIEAIGLTPKRHPCCASTHNTLDMLLDLKARHGFGAADVAAVDTLVGTINRNNLTYPAPENEMQARFSMQYCVAAALQADRLRIADFTPAAVADPARRALLPLVAMRAWPPEEEDPSGYVEHRLRVTLKDGRDLTAARSMEKGTIDDPLDEEDRLFKYFDCCEGHLDGSAAAELYDRLRRLAHAPDIAFISDALAAAR